MKIKEYLKKTCIKHCAFAKKCGVEKSAFSRYVNGSRSIPKDTYKRIKKESNNCITEHDYLLS